MVTPPGGFPGVYKGCLVAVSLVRLPLPSRPLNTDPPMAPQTNQDGGGFLHPAQIGGTIAWLASLPPAFEHPPLGEQEVAWESELAVSDSESVATEPFYSEGSEWWGYSAAEGYGAAEFYTSGVGYLLDLNRPPSPPQPISPSRAPSDPSLEPGRRASLDHLSSRKLLRAEQTGCGVPR